MTTHNNTNDLTQERFAVLENWEKNLTQLDEVFIRINTPAKKIEKQTRGIIDQWKMNLSKKIESKLPLLSPSSSASTNDKTPILNEKLDSSKNLKSLTKKKPKQFKIMKGKKMKQNTEEVLSDDNLMGPMEEEIEALQEDTNELEQHFKKITKKAKEKKVKEGKTKTITVKQTVAPINSMTEVIELATMNAEMKLKMAEMEEKLANAEKAMIKAKLEKTQAEDEAEHHREIVEAVQENLKQAEMEVATIKGDCEKKTEATINAVLTKCRNHLGHGKITEKAKRECPVCLKISTLIKTACPGEGDALGHPCCMQCLRKCDKCPICRRAYKKNKSSQGWYDILTDADWLQNNTKFFDKHFRDDDDMNPEGPNPNIGL